MEEGPLEEDYPFDDFTNYLDFEGDVVEMGALDAAMEYEESAHDTLINQWVQNAPPRNVPCSLEDLPDKKKVLECIMLVHIIWRCID